MKNLDKKIPANTVLTSRNLSSIRDEYGSAALNEYYKERQQMLVDQGHVSRGGFGNSALTTNIGRAH